MHMGNRWKLQHAADNVSSSPSEAERPLQHVSTGKNSYLAVLLSGERWRCTSCSTLFQVEKSRVLVEHYTACALSFRLIEQTTDFYYCDQTGRKYTTLAFVCTTENMLVVGEGPTGSEI